MSTYVKYYKHYLEILISLKKKNEKKLMKEHNIGTAEGKFAISIYKLEKSNVFLIS